jgi:hypothetical protein
MVLSNLVILLYTYSRALRVWKIWARLGFLTPEAEAEANMRRKLPAQNPKIRGFRFLMLPVLNAREQVYSFEDFSSVLIITSGSR